MKVAVGFLLYACVLLVVVTNVLGLAWALAVQLVLLSLVILVGVMAYAWLFGGDEN